MTEYTIVVLALVGLTAGTGLLQSDEYCEGYDNYGYEHDYYYELRATTPICTPTAPATPTATLGDL